MNKFSVGIIGAVAVAMMCIQYNMDSRLGVLALLGIFGVVVADGKKG